MKAIKFALFGMLSMCLMLATEETPAADASAVTNPVHEGIISRVEAALKSGAVWIEDHLHRLLDNIETSLAGVIPPVDPTPAETAAALQADPSVPTLTAIEGNDTVQTTAEQAPADGAASAPSGEVEHVDAASASSEPAAEGEQHAE